MEIHLVWFEDYHAQLSNFIKTNELVDIIEESDITPIEVNGFGKETEDPM